MKLALATTAAVALLGAGTAAADSLQDRLASTEAQALTDQDLRSVHARAIFDDLGMLLDQFDQGTGVMAALDAINGNSGDPFNGDMSFLTSDMGAETLFHQIVSNALGPDSNPFGADWNPIFNCRQMALPSCDEANQTALGDLLP